ncbi:uncharacterized protein OCT59_015682 [Rhizophagus irregularis]|uniref:Uncharacterized protein n=1 Tax=Rhizophagus irregularis (strain DAOM 197198w) TaxID=1432141 RepID=A0A015IR85_RHIIW|nr:hypothetical protein RirG_186670 [Rhizophagus irregularis DAOM 197198w]UZO23339.1 hypothetical protein OCT59_015682 [Rhizophagus irregularis]GET55613.1 hypothetical protein GLOIN_2v1875323 [Rhizophagus irregularis DAOM 181602=DAOM 197198]
MRIGKTTPQVYSISREDLYKKFLGKNWIHETDEIDIEGIDIDTPEKPASDPNALDKFLANIYNPANNSQNVQEKPAEEKPAEEKPKPVIEEQPVSKRTPPLLPPKPDHLKEHDLLSDSDSTTADPVSEKPSAPEPDDYDVLDELLSDSDSTTVDPVLEQQPESPAESSTKSESLADSKSSTEPIVESSSEQLIPEPDIELEVDRDPEPKKGKELWAKYQDASDDYDWEILTFEVEECPTTRIEDKYQYYLKEVVDRFKDWIEYNGNLPKTPSRKELVDLIRAYKENRNAEIIPTPLGMKL